MNPSVFLSPIKTLRFSDKLFFFFRNAVNDKGSNGGFDDFILFFTSCRISPANVFIKEAALSEVQLWYYHTVNMTFLKK